MQKQQKIQVASNVTGGRFFLCDIIGQVVRVNPVRNVAKSMDLALNEILEGEAHFTAICNYRSVRAYEFFRRIVWRNALDLIFLIRECHSRGGQR